MLGQQNIKMKSHVCQQVTRRTSTDGQLMNFRIKSLAFYHNIAIWRNQQRRFQISLFKTYIRRGNSLYNGVNNQQDATIFSLINLFNSALHVSGDKFAHPQEHFLTLYTAFGTMHRLAAVSMQSTKSRIYRQKVLLRMGEFVARNM